MDFNKAVFIKTAEEMLLPLANICQLNESDKNVVPLSQTMLSSSVNAAVIFRSECHLWLQRIHRRLAGKRSIRRPFYCEICRKIPVEMFNILARPLKMSEFRPPFCYVAGNKKGKVISFTFLPLRKQFFQSFWKKFE